LLAQILGQLGTSGLALSVRRLTAAADSGSLHIDDLTIRRLHDACDDLRGMHLLLMEALGKKLPNAEAHAERLSVQFIRAAINPESFQ
jgi:chloramphenicol 3-O-phosphotransferase